MGDATRNICTIKKPKSSDNTMGSLKTILKYHNIENVGDIVWGPDIDKTVIAKTDNQDNIEELEDKEDKIEQKIEQNIEPDMTQDVVKTQTEAQTKSSTKSSTQSPATPPTKTRVNRQTKKKSVK